MNAANVATLQAYVREHTFVGSASLVFHKKPCAEGGALDELRVSVGKGVNACVDSMACALGESKVSAPKRPAAPATEQERWVREQAVAAFARRATRAVEKKETRWLSLRDLADDALATSRRRARQRATAHVAVKPTHANPAYVDARRRSFSHAIGPC